MIGFFVFFLILSILVLIHEFGHFIVARKNGVWVEEFGIGLPPRVFGKKIGETLYSVNALPFGGFVKLHGESSEEGISDPARAFINKSKKSKVAIIVAGVVMNFILAIFCFGVVYSISGISKETDKVKVLEVTASSPAQVAGILVGDQIKKVNGQEIKEVSEFIKLVEEKKGQRVVFEIGRTEGESQKDLKFTITPRETPPDGEGPLGVSISSTEVYYPPMLARPFVGAYYGLKEAVFWGQNVFMGITGIFTDLFRGQAPKDLGSPVAIYAVTSEATKYGWLAVVNLLGILSINLAILNIMPFPALDGGRLLFILIEGVVGRKVAPKIEGYIHTVGMILLLVLLTALIFGDVQKLIQAGSVSNFLNLMTK